MLRLLRIRNFAIIDELELEFHAGFNAITGETGAGKSIILDAIGLILGNRANADVIRTGSDEATVEVLFDVGQNEALQQKIRSYSDLSIKLERSDFELLIKRTVHRNGKNKIFLNGELITLSQLADICENLVDLCSQHEHQSLAKPIFQLDLLDRYGGLLDKRREVRELFSALRSKENELLFLSGSGQERTRNEDFLRFQLTELEEFAPQESEEEQLNTERRRLLNASNLMESVGVALAMVGGDENSSEDALTLVARASQKLDKAVEMDEILKPAADALERARLELDESVQQLSSYAQSLEVDPSRLDFLEERLAKWGDMKKKYGATYVEIIQAKSKIEQELNEYAHRQERVAEVEAAITGLRKEFEKLARDLSKKRKNVAKTLQQSVQQELGELLMPETRFEIQFTEGDWSADGLDRIQFMFSPNPGEELKPVGKIASGGELSRLMLSIRRTIADRGGIGVYLFDEIDAGIGGQTASVVGRKLKSVAKYNQIICITHLPQVAVFANAHYWVSKKVADKRTTSQITLLEGPKRVEEIARMLGGLNVTEKSRAHARDLVREASR